MNKLQPTTIYVPFPSATADYALFYWDTETDQWEHKKYVVKKEDQFCFSREELQKILQDAFDAGVTLGRDYELSGGCPAARNKEDYIKNLLNK